MSTPQPPDADGPVSPGRYWPVPTLRALPALAAGLLITFLQDHSSVVGLLVFGGYAVLSGALAIAHGIRRIDDPVTRTVFLIQGVVAVLMGASALAMWNGGLGLLMFVLPVFLAITGFLELYAGLRSRRTTAGRDWLTVGAATAIAALVFLFLPPDSVFVTGLFGAYGVILGVYLIIAGLSLRFAKASENKEVAA